MVVYSKFLRIQSAVSAKVLFIVEDKFNLEIYMTFV